MKLITKKTLKKSNPFSGTFIDIDYWPTNQQSVKIRPSNFNMYLICISKPNVPCNNTIIEGYFITNILAINNWASWISKRNCLLPCRKKGVIEREKTPNSTKVSLFVQCIKKQLITLQNFNIQTCFSQVLWLFSLKFW